MLSGLTRGINFLKSRQKLLLKRRRRDFKNRIVTRKTLEEEKKVGNYAFEVKKMQIKKDLDKRRSQNHHLNEIIEEMFYPEFQLRSEEEAAERAQQVARGEMGADDDLGRGDELEQLIKEEQLPVDLLKVHAKKGEEFEAGHYELMLNRISYYCAFREKIQAGLTRAWERAINQLRKSKQLKKTPQCPYLFLTREEIPRHEMWMKLEKGLLSHLQSCEELGQVNQFIDSLTAVHRIFKFIPAEWYETVIRRNAQADFADLTEQDHSKVLNLIRLRHTIRQQDQVVVSGEETDHSQLNIRQLGMKIAECIINSPERYTHHDFVNVFKIVHASKKRMNILTPELIEKSAKIVQMVLGELTFTEVETFMSIYAMFSGGPDLELMELLKFDLYRKAHTEQYYNVVFRTIARIKDGKLTYKALIHKGEQAQFIQVEGMALLVKLTEVLSQFLPKMETEQLLTLLDTYFNNRLPQPQPLEVLATEIVKRGKSVTLNELGKAFFKLTLMGHRSKILAKFCVSEFVERYHSQEKKVKQEGTFLLPSEDGKQLPGADVNFRHIHLQECLLMVLWSLTQQIKENLRSEANLQEILGLVPVWSLSSDPLAIKMVRSINDNLSQYDFFPKIGSSPASAGFPSGRLDEFSKYPIEVKKTREKEEKEVVRHRRIYDIV